MTDVLDLNMDLIEELNEQANPGKQARVYTVTDAERGQFEEVKTGAAIDPMSLSEDKIPYPRDHRGRITVDNTAPLLETSTGAMSTANFPELLRQGIRFDSFLSYRGIPVTYPLFVQQMTSNKQKEQWLRDAGMGIPPVVHEGEEYPEAALDLEGDVTITNYKRGYKLRITEEMRRFDQVGKVRQISGLIGRSFRMGEEYEVYNVISNSSNYTRNSTTDDNDIGANYAATTFSPTGLIAAWRTLVTMKDRKSGDYLGVQPDTLIVAPGVWLAAQQLLRSPETMRNADSGSGTDEVYGTGTRNSFFGLVNTIVVSPWLSSTYGWVLMEKSRAVMFQRVAPFEILGPDFKNIDDTWHYRARNWFGVGMLDDRFAYLSTSSTAPAVD